MDEGRRRLSHIRNDPRVALTVLDETGWYTHVSITGHVVELREDTSLADIDTLSQRYTGQPYPNRDRSRVSAFIRVDNWHGWGTHKDTSQVG